MDIRLLYGADGFEKAVMWALLELKQRREKDLVRKAHRITYGD